MGFSVCGNMINKDSAKSYILTGVDGDRMLYLDPITGSLAPSSKGAPVYIFGIKYDRMEE